MVQHPDHCGPIKESIYEGQTVNIPSYIGVLDALAQSLLGLLELGQGVIQQNNPLETLIARSIAARPRANLQEQFTAGR